MPVCDDPVDRLVDFEDRFSEFTRFTLQGEKDFHVGLRTDLELEYQRYGVKSESCTSTPSPSTFKVFNDMDIENENNSAPALPDPDDATQEASKIVSSVLSQVNDKLSSGELKLVNDNTDCENGHPVKSVTSNDTIDSVTTISETPANKSETFQATSIPELEEAIKSISQRMEQILSPSKSGDKEELLGEIKTQISAQSVKVHELNCQVSQVSLGGSNTENSKHKVAELEKTGKSEHVFMTELVEKPESSTPTTKDPVCKFEVTRSSMSQCSKDSIVDSTPQSVDKDEDSEQFNFEEIIRKKTGRGLEESVHMDVEAEKEWELETENMPMDIITSPNISKSYPINNKEGGTENGSVTRRLNIEDADGESNLSKNNSSSLQMPAISDDKKSAEVLEGEVSVLQKEVKWLEEEVKALRETVVERNARLAESHQLRRNLEEELSLMHRKNSGLEQTTAATMKQLHKKIEEGQVQIRTQSQDVQHSMAHMDDSKSHHRNSKSKLCTIL